MKASILSAVAALSLLATAAHAEDAPKWSLAIHGGAGVIERAELSPERDAAYRAALQTALNAGSAVLANGGSALDAVQAAVQSMEDNPLFNAGRGAVFTAAGKNELDSAVMNGVDRTAGAVAGLTHTRHPIAAARAVMEKSPHVMLIGEGAETFAASVGLEQVDPSFFFTESRWQALLKALRDKGLPLPARPAGAPPEPSTLARPVPLASLNEAPLDERKFGTVGAVALDSQGRLAAATSTAGVFGKMPGRVGDTPIPAAGTWADDHAAVSCTGQGEYFIRVAAAARTAFGVAAGQPLAEAAQATIDRIGGLGGDGGLIALDRQGNITHPFNSQGMKRAWLTTDGEVGVQVFDQ